MRKKSVVGLVLFLMGVVVLLHGSGMTGFVVSEKSVGFGDVGLRIVGLFVAVGGALLYASALEKLTSSEYDFVQTARFMKDVRGHDKRKILAAVRKIGSGVGGEHRLKGRYQGNWAIRSGDRSGRIIFTYSDPHTVQLLGYNPDHKYKGN